MGHIRLGRIPKRGPWRAVFNAFSESAANPEALANATARASAERFELLRKDGTINYCVWTLVRVINAAQSHDFPGELRKIGITVNQATSGVEFVTQLSRLVQDQTRARGAESVFAAIAQRALHSVLTSAIADRASGLFGSELEDIQSACRDLGTKERFGLTARQFFATFMSSTVRFVADKEVANHIGSEKALESVDSIDGLHRSIDRYCNDSGQLIQDYAASWFSKKNWETQWRIEESDTGRFTAYALRKLHMELSGVGQ